MSTKIYWTKNVFKQVFTNCRWNFCKNFTTTASTGRHSKAAAAPALFLSMDITLFSTTLDKHQYQDIISDYSSVRYVARNDIANVTHPWTKRYTLKIFSVIWGKNKLLIQITSNWQKDHCVKNRTEQTLTIRLFTKHVFTLDLFRKTYTINKRNLYDWATNSFHCPTTISGLLCSKCYASSPRRHISPFWLHNIRL